jgi:NADH-quinone oxidoreductase subunit N
MNEQLQLVLESLSYFVPELWLGGTFVCLLLIEIGLKRSKFALQTAKVLQLCFAFVLVVAGLLVWQQHDLPSNKTFFHGLLYLDSHALFFKQLITLGSLAVLGHIYFGSRNSEHPTSNIEHPTSNIPHPTSNIEHRTSKTALPTEIYAILTAAVLGLYLMTMAFNWPAVYLSIELVSVCSYLLVAMPSGLKAAEGGLKYLLFGAVSAAIMLYGISWLYGLSGTFDLAMTTHDSPMMLAIGLLLMCGLLFKLSLVPFHVWTPDVYEAAPLPVVAFISTLPKVATLLIFYRLVGTASVHFQLLMACIALSSILAGNLSALWQNDFKRLLAYSSIAQAGFMLIGLVSIGQGGFEATTFYAAIYVAMNLSALFIFDILGDGKSNISDMAGLGLSKPFLSVLLLLVMVSLVGLPPTAGFTAKLLVFASLYQSYQQSSEPLLMVLLMVGLLNAAISLFFYLKTPYFLFFKANKNDISNSKLSIWIVIFVLILTLPLLLFFFKPDWL